MKHFTPIIVTLFISLQLEGTTFYSHRSFNQEGAQTLINYAAAVPYSHSDNLSNTITITSLYSHTIHRSDIASSLFGDDLFPFNGRDVIRVSGTRVAERGPKDWLADYFGLRQDFASFLSFEPFIENSVLDFEWFSHLGSCSRIYARIRAPLVNTRWSIELIEHSVQTSCDTEYPPGYFADTSIFYQDISDDTLFLGIPCRQLLCSFRQYSNDCLAPNLVTPNNATIFEPLQFSKMSRDPLVKTHLSELQATVGYSIIKRPSSGISIEGTIWFPTGNKPEGHFIFEPIVGNGHHWQVAIGVLGNCTVLQNPYTEKEIIIYGYGYLAHLFSTCQVRTFDLCNSANSRYMLAQKMGTPVTNIAFDGQAPSAQFKGIFTPVANLTTIPVDVSVAWQTEIALMLQYRVKNIYVDVGYTYWGRADEAIKFPKHCSVCFEHEQWSLKGDSFVYGFVPDDFAETDIANMPIALSSSQSNATIHSGTTRPIGAPPLEPINRNAGVDNRTPATLPDGTFLVYEPLLTEQADNQQRSSYNPILLHKNDINLASAQTKGASHRLFTHISYTWSDHCPFIPSLGIGFMIEQAHARSTPGDNSFATPSQLAIWLKGGFTF